MLLLGEFLPRFAQGVSLSIQDGSVGTNEFGEQETGDFFSYE